MYLTSWEDAPNCLDDNHKQCWQGYSFDVINELANKGYKSYSVTTDGFITNAPTEIVRGLDAFGFGNIFQQGRYTLNQRTDECEANQVWEPKHFNDIFLNITTRSRKVPPLFSSTRGISE